MTSKPPKAGSRSVLRSLRIVTGLYLLLYVTLHLINLSLGLFSVEVMDAARPYLSGLIGRSILDPLLSTAFVVHYLIGLWSVYTRPRISGTAQDVVQALSGLAIVPLLAIHAVGIVMLQNANVEVTYDFIIRIFWISNPIYGLIQVIVLSVAWVHGAAGLFMWLRSKPSMTRHLPWMYPLAVAVPVLALLGFTEAGRVALVEGAGPQIVRTEINGLLADSDVPFAWIVQVQYLVVWTSLAISFFVLVARAVRQWMAKSQPVHIDTKNVGKISALSGQYLLDAFRSEGQAHANLCAGRGRCGTCAVRILSSQRDLPDPTPLEQATLDRINRGRDVRLACQLPLAHGSTLSVERIFPPDFTFEARQDDETSPEEVPA